MSIISADDYEPPLRLVQPKSYTLAELEGWAKQWAIENEATNDARWIVSHLFAWLKRREKEKRE